MSVDIREREIQDAICESLASQDWTDEVLLRKQAESRLGHRVKRYEFSRAIVALVRAERIERRRSRLGTGDSLTHMQYRRIAL